MDKLVRQLRRELTRNPKKSALLGCGLLAAIYFWAPLVSGWISKSEPGKSESRASEAQPDPVNGDAVEAAAAPEEKLLPGDWRELARRIEQEPLRRLAGLAAPKRDPFFRIAEPAQASSGGGVGLPAALQPAAPRGLAELGLKLEAVLIRGRSRAAIINGAVYRESQPLAATQLDDAASRPRPMVLEIHADHVEIGWEDERLRLELERPELAPGDRIAPMAAH